MATTPPPSSSPEASTAAPNQDFTSQLRVFNRPPVVRVRGGRIDDEGLLRKYVVYDVEVLYNGCTWRVEIQKATINALWLYIKTHRIRAPTASVVHNDERGHADENAAAWPSLKKLFVAGAEHSVRPDMMTLVEPYLTAVMHVPALLHSCFVASMLEVSATTFAGDQGGRTSNQEGWLKARFWLTTSGADSKAMEPRWVVLRPSSIALYVTIQDKDAIEALLFDPKLKLERGTDEAGSKKTLLVSNAQFSLQLEAETTQQMQTWANTIAEAFAKTEWSQHHRDGSFAIPRSPTEYPSAAQWFVDGKDAYASIYETLLSAKKQIFIAGWWVCPTIHLLRPATKYPESRLDLVLKKKAEEGVKVYVLMYKEVAVALTLNSAFSKEHFNGLHVNVDVLRDPDFLIKQLGLWSHHEKIVSVDQNISFVGGLDLCFGRWDTHNHALFDEPMPKFVGKDYSNPRVKDFIEVDKPDEDLIDRTIVPRMPWHDCHCRLEGQPARDVARHFIQRWNYSVSNRRKASTLYHLVPKNNYERRVEDESTEGTRVIARGVEVRGQQSIHLRGIPCSAQILRSISEWSGGVNTERSIQDAYLRLIDSAKHFVYIENQFFVSGLEGDEECANRIAQALVARINRAAANGENFRVMVVMPLLPAFPGRPDGDDASSLRGVMHWQYRTICRGEHSVYHALSQSLPAGSDAMNYISFYGLRTHSDTLPSNSDEPETELVYVHSKVMIVDDRYAIIGSANINERSMNGDRDSEIAVLVEDTELTSSITIAQGASPVGKFCHSFRMKLFEEHFGVAPNTVLYEQYADPVNLHTWQVMQQHAAKNAKIYDSVFACMPSDNIKSFAEIPVELVEPEQEKESSSGLAEAVKAIGDWFTPGDDKDTDSPAATDEKMGKVQMGEVVPRKPVGRPDSSRQTSLTTAMTMNFRDNSQMLGQKNELSAVQGQIVTFPLQFLVDEDLEPKLLPNDLFQ